MATTKTTDAAAIPTLAEATNAKQRKAALKEQARKAAEAAAAAKAQDAPAEPKADEPTPEPTTTPTLPALPKLKRARKPKAPKSCECGCGGQTRGGRFVPGHDAKLAGWVLRVERKLIALADIPHDGIRSAVAGVLATPKPQPEAPKHDQE